MSKKQNRTHSRSNAVVKNTNINIIAAVCLGLFAIILVSYLLISKTGLFKLNFDSINPIAITDARRNVESGHTKDIQNRMKVLDNSSVASLDGKNNRSAIDECVIRSSEAGWTVKSWHQDCRLESIILLETKATPSEILTLVLESDTTKIFKTMRPIESDCDLFYQDDVLTLTYISSLKNNSYNCKIPELEKQSEDLRIKKKVESSIDAEYFNQTNSYILVHTKINYFSKDVGCKSGIYIGCNVPLSTPITDFN